MKFVGLAVLFTGYSVTYYGLTQIKGGNWGVLDLTLPTRWANAQSIPKDGQSAAGTSPQKPAASPSILSQASSFFLNPIGL